MYFIHIQRFVNWNVGSLCKDECCRERRSIQGHSLWISFCSQSPRLDFWCQPTLSRQIYLKVEAFYLIRQFVKCKNGLRSKGGFGELLNGFQQQKKNCSSKNDRQPCIHRDSGSRLNWSFDANTLSRQIYISKDKLIVAPFDLFANFQFHKWKG